MLTLLSLAVIVIVAVLMGMCHLRYKHRLRMRDPRYIYRHGVPKDEEEPPFLV